MLHTVTQQQGMAAEVLQLRYLLFTAGNQSSLPVALAPLFTAQGS